MVAATPSGDMRVYVFPIELENDTYDKLVTQAGMKEEKDNLK